MVKKVAVRAIVDLRAPRNIIFTKLVKKLGLLPDIAHKQVFGTASLASTISLGAYSALPLHFWEVTSVCAGNYSSKFKL